MCHLSTLLNFSAQRSPFSGAAPSSDDEGLRHLTDFVGEWKVDIWSLDADGKRITARGTAKGVLDSKTTARLDFAGIHLDESRNENVQGESRISTEESGTEIWVIPTNEELIVARQSLELVQQDE